MAECQIDVRNTTSVLSHTPLNARAINKKYYVLGSMLFRSLLFLRFYKNNLFLFPLCFHIFQACLFKKIYLFHFVCLSWPKDRFAC